MRTEARRARHKKRIGRCRDRSGAGSSFRARAAARPANGAAVGSAMTAFPTAWPVTSSFSDARSRDRCPLRQLASNLALVRPVAQCSVQCLAAGQALPSAFCCPALPARDRAQGSRPLVHWVGPPARSLAQQRRQPLPASSPLKMPKKEIHTSACPISRDEYASFLSVPPQPSQNSWRKHVGVAAGAGLGSGRDAVSEGTKA